MKMNKTLIAAGLTLATLVSSQASAANIFNSKDLIINLDAISSQTGVATNGYDTLDFCNLNQTCETNGLTGSTFNAGSGDADSTTGDFFALSFGELLATSVYPGDGTFYDTNVDSELLDLGIVAGTDLVSVNQLGDVSTLTAGSKKIGDLISLSNTDFTSDSDDEGYGSSWTLAAEFYISGDLFTGAPNYNSGHFELYFVDLLNAQLSPIKVLGANFSDDSVQINNETADVELDFEITFAEDGFWNIANDLDDLTDTTDLASLIPTAQEKVDGDVGPMMDVNFSVEPATPTPEKLVLTQNADGDDVWVRQANLTGQAYIPTPVPAPTGLALLGLAALGLAGARRFKA